MNRPKFKFVGGWPCLDFVNSQNWDSRDPVYERFHQYSDLVWWNFDVGALSEQEKEGLLEAAAQNPARATAVFEQALALREIIHHTFAKIAAGQPPQAVEPASLNAAIGPLLGQSKIIATEQGFKRAWSGEVAALERVLWPIGWSAFELLLSDQLERVGQCAGESCGWLFLDTSRNRRRRWCEMQHCGNRAKARRYYRRRQSTEAN